MQWGGTIHYSNKNYEIPGNKLDKKCVRLK